MITVKQARQLGRDDRAEGIDTDQLENIAESIAENYGGKAGHVLAAAYRKGAGIR